ERQSDHDRRKRIVQRVARAGGGNDGIGVCARDQCAGANPNQFEVRRARRWKTVGQPADDARDQPDAQRESPVSPTRSHADLGATCVGTLPCSAMEAKIALMTKVKSPRRKPRSRMRTYTP